MESYTTMRSGFEAVGEFEDRRSRFIAHLVHIESEDAAASHQAEIRAHHYDARHNVPAWILADGRERASDDGEPQRTSGLPTLEVLRGAGLKDVSCVTTRYFGGTLLGPGGLVRAYTAAAQAAVEAARAAGQLMEMTGVVPVDVRLAYADHDRVLDLAARCGGKVAGTEYTAEVLLHLVFRAGEEAPFLAVLRETMSGRENVQVGDVRFAEF
ncbi:MAG: DUF1949 domain-containing protein [Coriobacteriaceae bacterium]|nr:DUF1949 domain-containing protein [Coriobacteriaceae bacterium]